MRYGKDRWKSTWEVILYAIKGEEAKHGKNISAYAYRKWGKGFDVFIYPQPRPLLHKAQKPLGLVMKLIDCSSNEGDLVLDPFVGSGTTAVACKLLNRDFIGFDNDPKWVEIARRRVESTTPGGNNPLKEAFG